MAANGWPGLKGYVYKKGGASRHMDKKRLQYLLDQQHCQRLTTAEEQELNAWFGTLHFDPGLDALTEEQQDQRYRRFKSRLAQPVKWPRVFAVAASVVLLASLALLLHKTEPAAQRFVAPGKAASARILPGSDQAILEMGGGREVTLDGKPAGSKLRFLNGSQVIRQGNGHVSYALAGHTSSSEINAIRTPRGGQYRVTLSDGTNVWLNAASSISFPVSFHNHKTRKVTLTGQAYFEVARSATQPFVVAVSSSTHAERQMEVEVLGTHFDVMAYDDESAFHATLIEGSVRVRAAGGLETIKPGQRASVDRQMRVVAADTETAIAWKNGITAFREARIESIMRQISRWYNVDVVYDGKVNNRLFTGEISRRSSLAQVLRVLELSKIAFETRGRTIVVKPQ
ncbi:FecR family protein [Pedobacter yulinensis]|uniref:FecR family protein n=1 Tax=Pedobacter yulinensis TaxID=2126353 RepID=UPI0013A67875|nr:FecR family protein [Pedobacter yulinensis]